MSTEIIITDEMVDAALDHTWSGGFDRNGSHMSGEYVEYENSFHNPGDPRSAIRELIGAALSVRPEVSDWEKAALEVHGAMTKYRSLLLRIGEILGPDANVDASGQLTGEVQIDLLPDTVQALTEDFDSRTSVHISSIFDSLGGLPSGAKTTSISTADSGKDRLGQAVDLLRDLLLHDDGTAEARATRFVLTYQKERS